MPGLLIRDIPRQLYGRLKDSATRHHRSISKEALVILEETLGRKAAPGELPRPIKGRFPITQTFLDEARSEGRD